MKTEEQIAMDEAAVAAVLKETADEPTLPSVEDYAPLRAAREHVSRIAAELSAAKGRRRELAESLGLKGKIDAGKLDGIAAQLIASGKPADQIDALESATKAVRRLQAAREVAEVKVGEEYQRAVAAAEPAVQAFLLPAARGIALAHANLVRAVRERVIRLGKLRGAGFIWQARAEEPGFFSGDEFALRQHFRDLVARGVLAEADVSDLIH